MNHEPFLAAIAAEPLEPGARLVYADWLEDQGDTRAELIRVMEEMHTLAPYSDRFWELRPRRARLKQGVSDEWLTALGYNVYRPLFTHLPAEREHRWRLITEFIETWHGPLGDSPGNTEEEIVRTETMLQMRLPAAMREWYGRFGRRREYWGRAATNGLWCDLVQIRAESRSLIYPLGSRVDMIDAEDPVVYLPPDSQVASTFSTATILMLFYWMDAYGTGRQWFGDPHDDCVEEIRSKLPICFSRSAIPTRLLADAIQIWETTDMLCVDYSDAEDLRFISRSRSAMARLPPDLNALISWDQGVARGLTCQGPSGRKT